MKWPSEQTTVPFHVAMEDVTAGNPKVLKRDFLHRGGLAIVDQGQGLIAGYTNDQTLAFKEDLPVIVFGDHTCVLKFVDFPFALGADGVRILAARKGYHTKFLYYFLLSSPVVTTGYSRHFKYLKEKRVPVFPSSEQHRIVEILDQADQLRKKRAEADAKATRILPALFYKMFGDPATNPKGWPVHPFSKLFFQDKAAVDESSGKHLPYLGLEHIESESGRILSSEAEGLSVKVRGLAFRFGPQHVLYGKLRPYLNKVALPSFEGRCSTELVPLMPKPGVLREFVAAYLRLPYIVNAAMTTNKGARMPRTDMHLLLEMKVPIPDIGIQNIFAMTYSAVSRTTVSNQKVGSRIENLFSVLLHRAFTGNLTAKWREAHMKELLAEMETQAKALNVRIGS